MRHTTRDRRFTFYVHVCICPCAISCSVFLLFFLSCQFLCLFSCFCCSSVSASSISFHSKVCSGSRRRCCWLVGLFVGVLVCWCAGVLVCLFLSFLVLSCFVPPVCLFGRTSVFAPSGTWTPVAVSPHARQSLRNLRNILRILYYQDGSYLVVATYCHIDDPTDVLDLWDPHGSLYFLNHTHLSLHHNRGRPRCPCQRTAPAEPQWTCGICRVLTSFLEHDDVRTRILTDNQCRTS